MRKKGFTLIELLAVIVILAIIALIAVPQILKVIERANKGAAVDSAYGYIDAVEKYMVMHDIDANKYPYKLVQGKTYYVNNKGEISYNNLIEKVMAEELEETSNTTSDVEANFYLESVIKVKGTSPSKGKVVIGEKNKVSSAELLLNNYKVICDAQSCHVDGEIVNNNSNNNTNNNISASEVQYGNGKTVQQALDELRSGV